MSTLTTDVLTHRAAALVGEIDMATREGWSAHRIHELEEIRVEVLDELHGRAAVENTARDTVARFAKTDSETLSFIVESRKELPDPMYPEVNVFLIQAALEELHGRAIAEDVERGIEHLDDEGLGLSLEFALLLDVQVPRTAIAIRVLRDRLHEHALAERPVSHAEPEECEHGLSAWLCTGPGHYPF